MSGFISFSNITFRDVDPDLFYVDSWSKERIQGVVYTYSFCGVTKIYCKSSESMVPRSCLGVFQDHLNRYKYVWLTHALNVKSMRNVPDELRKEWQTFVLNEFYDFKEGVDYIIWTDKSGNEYITMKFHGGMLNQKIHCIWMLRAYNEFPRTVYGWKEWSDRGMDKRVAAFIAHKFFTIINDRVVFNNDYMQGGYFYFNRDSNILNIAKRKYLDFKPDAEPKDGKEQRLINKMFGYRKNLEFYGNKLGKIIRVPFAGKIAIPICLFSPENVIETVEMIINGESNNG